MQVEQGLLTEIYCKFFLTSWKNVNERACCRLGTWFRCQLLYALQEIKIQCNSQKGKLSNTICIFFPHKWAFTYATCLSWVLNLEIKSWLIIYPQLGHRLARHTEHLCSPNMASTAKEQRQLL